MTTNTTDIPATFRRGRRVVVPLWRGPEVWRLRTAKRMTVRAFGHWLGVSDRMISKWEAGTVPSLINQEALDVALERLSPAELARFRALPRERPPRERAAGAEPAPVVESVPVPTPSTDRPPVELWSDPDLRAALRAHDIARLFATLGRHGWSQRRIAALVGMSQSEISEVLGGRRVGQYHVLARICTGLGIPRGLMGLGLADAEPPAVRGVRPDRISVYMGSDTGPAYNAGSYDTTVPVDG